MYFRSILLLVIISIVTANIEPGTNGRNFTGKVVLVTGSSSGIGEVTAKEFSRLGASVVITGRNVTEISRVAQEVQQLSPYKLKVIRKSQNNLKIQIISTKM